MDEFNPYEDKDKTLKLVQKVVEQITADIMSAEDLFDDKTRGRIMASCINLLEQLGEEISNYITPEIVEAYQAGWELGGSLLAESGLEGIQGNLVSLVHANAVQSIALEAIDDMQAAIRTAIMSLISINDTLQAVHDQIGEGLIKGRTTRDMTKAIQREFAEVGLTSFVTIDNRRLPLDFYAMTVTRTKVRKAQVKGSLNRYIENDLDLVRINKRAYTCKVCGEREGLVVSIAGNTPGYPTFDDIGGEPPFHPNCKHYIIPVTESDLYPPKPFTGVDKRTEASKETYETEQKIRVKANQEKKLYMKMKAEAEAAGDTFPNIGVWRRMKRKNDEKWKALQKQYRQSINRLPIAKS